MAGNTGIEWTDATWNPIRGCSRVSEGCRNCYAEGVAKRFSKPGLPYEGLIAKGGQWNGEVRFIDDLLGWPLRKRKPQRIFVNSMSDLFHETVPDAWIDRIFAVMALAKQHTFQVLTKRPERMLAYMQRLSRSAKILDDAARTFGHTFFFDGQYLVQWPIPNVWLGVSVEDQATADERIPLLLQTPAAVRWVSAEPLLGPVDLLYSAFDGAWAFKEMGRLDWVVVGGESGRRARPMHPDWARSLRDQCQAAGVPFLFKQWGNWCPSDAKPEPGKYTGGGIFLRHDGSLGSQVDWWDGNAAAMDYLGKKAAGRLLDNRLHDEYPEARQ